MQHGESVAADLAILVPPLARLAFERAGVCATASRRRGATWA